MDSIIIITQTRSRDKLPSLSLVISMALPLSPVLVDQPATTLEHSKEIHNLHSSLHTAGQEDQQDMPLSANVTL